MQVLASYKAAYKPDRDVSEEAKRQAFRQALAKAEGLIKSETINGVEYFWFGMPF